MGSSKVMALVPAYNSAGFIQQTLDSLSAQTHSNFEVLISVDVCGDNTYDVCKAHCERDLRFQVIRQEGERLGYAGNCNFLMNKAEADYVMLAFHDDLLDPTYSEKLCAVLDNRPEVVLAYPDTLLTDVDGSQVLWKFRTLEGVSEPTKRAWIMLRPPKLWWVPNRGMFRLARSKRINGIKPHNSGEFSVDWPWLFHMSILGEFARVPEVLCMKFLKPDGLAKSWEFNRKQWYDVSVSCMRELWSSELTTLQKTRLAVPLLRKLVRMRVAKAMRVAESKRLITKIG